MELDFTNKTPVNDFAILVEGRKLYCNRGLLCVWSRYFERMFTESSMKSCCDEITITDKSYDEINELLHVIYPPNEPIDGQNVESMLKLAKEYEIALIIERCRVYLMKQERQTYNLKDVIDSCVTNLHQKSIIELEQNKKFKDINKEILNAILGKRTKILESEIDSKNEEIKSHVSENFQLKCEIDKLYENNTICHQSNGFNRWIQSMGDGFNGFVYEMGKIFGKR